MRHRGVALLLALVVLVVAGLALGAVARHHLATVRQADEAARTLHAAWLEHSALSTLAPQTAALFDTAPTTLGDEPSPERRWTITLPNRDGPNTPGTPTTTLTVTAANESAKLNLITWLQAEDAPPPRTLTHALHLDPNRLQPTPSSLPDAPTNWAILVPDITPPEVAALTRVATLWGDGQLDARFAPDAVLEAVVAPYLTPGETARLLDERRATPDAAPGTWLRASVPDEDGRTRRVEVLTDTAGMLSLAVSVRTGERAGPTLFVVFDPASPDTSLHRQRLLLDGPVHP